MRLNGWQRIGVVVSVIWAVGVGFYMMTGLNWASAAHRICINVTDVKNPGEHLEQCYATFKRNLPAAMQQQRNEAMLFALAPIPVAWVLAYLSVGIVRWVRRGF